MFLYFINWDIRGIIHYLDPLSRLYVLFLAFATFWIISIPIRIAIRKRSTRDEETQTALARTKLVSYHRNLSELFVLDLILFAGCFCYELFMGLASERFVRCNPNIDVIGPFDELVFVSLVGFAGLGLIHCVRWFVLMKIEHEHASRGTISVGGETH